ncbi:MAG: lytic transglycosylase protein, partial [Conexibacter sp.]|nr:lytic transglycosylase protein [Conexibacter sp.]
MSHEPSLPTPPRERWPLAIALVTLVAGAALLGVALAGVLTKGKALPAPPAVPAVIVMTPA